MQSSRKCAIKKLKTLTYNGKIIPDMFRSKIDNEFKTVFLPNGVERTEYVYANIKCDILAPEIYSSNRIMIYIHGGSFVGGSRVAYRNFCSSLAAKCFCRVIVPEYRLAPASPFPAANEDIQQVFKAVFTEEQIACSLNSQKDQKNQLPEIIIAADGSAASIACSLIFNLKEKYRVCVKNLILFSPWLDFSNNSSLMTSKKKICDEVLSNEILKKSVLIYTYESNLSNQYVSPLCASKDSLQNFPQTFIQMGEKEITLNDAKEFTKMLKESGNKCTLDIWENMIFMFQMADEFFYESHLALDKIGKIVTENLCGEKTVQIENQPKLERSLKSEA